MFDALPDVKRIFALLSIFDSLAIFVTRGCWEQNIRFRALLVVVTE